MQQKKKICYLSGLPCSSIFEISLPVGLLITETVGLVEISLLS
jgi:hypothetical protein